MPDPSQAHASPADTTLDAVVAGGGIVGAAAALGLMTRGDRVRWLRQAQPIAPLPDGYAARVYALSPGNLAWLETLGVTRHLDTTRIGSVRDMQIRARHGNGLDLSAQQAGVAEMALIIESDNLLRALEAAVAAQGERDAGPSTVGIAGMRQVDGALRLELDEGATLATRMLVAADGAGSPLRTHAGIDAVAKDYGHRAVVANFVCERPHRGIACQWFDKPPQSFPLRRQRARRLTAPRMALVGDAAHVVHPLAGQGMNLGLRDVRALLEATAGRRDPGSAHTLARYQALRQFDVHSIEAVTDSLFRMFGDPLAAFVGGHGMGLLNHLAPLKSELVRQAMR